MIEHGWCLRWDPYLIGAHFVGDFMIWMAYVWIPLSLLLVARQVPFTDKLMVIYRWLARKQQPPTLERALPWSVAFVASCGLTHAVDIWVVVTPAYWFQAYVKFATGLISLRAALLFTVLVVDVARVTAEEEMPDDCPSR